MFIKIKICFTQYQVLCYITATALVFLMTSSHYRGHYWLVIHNLESRGFHGRVNAQDVSL